MRTLIAGLILTVAATGTGQDPKSPEGSKKTAPEEVVRQFVTAFFNEDEKALLSLAAGRAAGDLKAYFWIKRTIHGEAAGVPRRWDGKIEILGKSRKKVFSTEIELVTTEADVFEVKVAGKPFLVGLDDAARVILFSEPSK